MKALTPSGRVVAVAAVILAVGAVALHYPELVVVSVGAAVAVLGALVWTRRDHPVVISRTLTHSRVAVGAPAEAVVTVTRTRPGRRGQATTLRARDRIQIGRAPAEEVDVLLPPATDGSGPPATYPVPTGRRGVVTLGPLVVARVDPLGLARRTIGRAEATTLWVHPRVHVTVAPGGGRRAHPEGGDDVSSPQATTTFESLREYVIGDDLRRIHWRSTAHVGTLMVRNDLDTALPTCVLWLDTDRASYTSDEQFEEAVEVTASVVVAAVGDAVPVRLMSSGGLDVDGTRCSRTDLLDRLTTIELDDRGPTGGRDRLRDPRRTLLLVAVTGPASHGDAGRLELLGRRFGEAVVLRVGEGPTAADLCRSWTGAAR